MKSSLISAATVRLTSNQATSRAICVIPLGPYPKSPAAGFTSHHDHVILQNIWLWDVGS